MHRLRTEYQEASSWARNSVLRAAGYSAWRGTVYQLRRCRFGEGEIERSGEGLVLRLSLRPMCTRAGSRCPAEVMCRVKDDYKLY